MPILGAHMSIAGGIHKAVERASAAGCECLQIFEQLGAMLGGVQDPDRLGVCLDTCHIFAAGYRLHGERNYEDTIRQLKKWVGIRRVKAIHLNDSQRARGARVDRHAHIGHGKLGWAPFRRLLNDPRFRRVPMYLETPKGDWDGMDADVRNLQALRRLVRKRRAARRP